MKIPYFFGLVVMLIVTNASISYSSYHNTNLVEQIKPNLMARSKPTYPQYAAVSFLKSDTGIDFARGQLDARSQCGALGYVIPVEKCTGDNKPSKLCSDDDAIKNVKPSIQDADKYTTGCCDTKIYTVTAAQVCPYNAAKLAGDKCFYDGASGKQNYYRCACDRGRYQYSTIPGEGCGYNGNVLDPTEFNVNLMCRAYDPSYPQGIDTEHNTYYFVSCCPKDIFKQCKDGTNGKDNNHEVGRGNECRALKDGTTQFKSENVVSKYEQCVCAPHYDTECPTDRIINRNFVCVEKDQNGTPIRTWTTESNCESSCSKTVETNIDSYLYLNSWHCLYRKEGAVIRDEEDNGGTCGIFNNINNEGELDSCYSQGYTKTIDDCKSADAVIRCPNDQTKVWCFDSKYCTGYDVGTFGGIDYCVNGANIKTCPLSNQGTRCQYQNSKCNCMWNDGLLRTDSAECLRYFYNTNEAENFFNSPTIDGNDQTCCKRGYKMRNGLCVLNECDRELFPYDQNPGSDAGNLKTCYQGDPELTLKYRSYFGYESCKSTEEGDLWIKEGEEGVSSRRCVCARNGELGGTHLPFDAVKYYDDVYNEKDHYIYVGFASGKYGDTATCTDGDATYYGYKSCYVGFRLGTEESNQGMCLKTVIARDGSGYYNYNDSTVPWAYVKKLITDTGESFIQPKFDLKKTEHCISKYNHCQGINGHTKGTETVCNNFLTEGCDYGYEEQCKSCYGTNNLKINEDGLYDWHGQFKMKVNLGRWDANTYPFITFEECPAGYLLQDGICYTYCTPTNLADCKYSSLLKEEDSSIILGLVTYVDTKTRQLYIANTDNKTATWADAVTQSSEYYPGKKLGNTTYQNHPVFGEGHWHLATATTAPRYFGTMHQTGYKALITSKLNANANSFRSAWEADVVKKETGEVDMEKAYCWNNDSRTMECLRTDRRYVTPVMELPY